MELIKSELNVGIGNFCVDGTFKAIRQIAAAAPTQANMCRSEHYAHQLAELKQAQLVMCEEPGQLTTEPRLPFVQPSAGPHPAEQPAAAQQEQFEQLTAAVEPVASTSDAAIHIASSPRVRSASLPSAQSTTSSTTGRAPLSARTTNGNDRPAAHWRTLQKKRPLVRRDLPEPSAESESDDAEANVLVPRIELLETNQIEDIMVLTTLGQSHPGGKRASSRIQPCKYEVNLRGPRGQRCAKAKWLGQNGFHRTFVRDRYVLRII